MSDEGERSCPLCAEEMDLTDQQLKPCRCGYEICVWCWHQILEMAEKEDTEGRCPACRVPYDKDKIVGMAANCERMVAEQMERKKSQKGKTKSSEARKQLSSVRVIQRNLVYIVGLPLNLADEDLLQRKEYFGQYGKVLKVSMSRTGTGVIQQFPNNTCSVYITYSKEEEAVRCIQSVHGFVLDGRSLKACFGTTKYCHAWLRNVPCTNPDCLYLHEIGSQEDSFTKDEIVSAFTRVQQITGATNNMLRRAGSMLPPPLDDYNCNSAASAPKPIVKTTSNNTTTSKSSPPNGNSGRSVALPAAASWGTRCMNQQRAASSTSSNGSTKSKSDVVNGTFAFSSAIVNSTQASALHCDVEKRTSWNEDGQNINIKVKPESLRSDKQNVGNVLEKLAVNDDPATTLSNQSTSPSSKHDDWGSSLVSNGIDSFDHIEQCSEKVGFSAADLPSMKTDNNVRSEVSGVTRTGSSLSDHSRIKVSGSPVLQLSHADQYREPLQSPETEKNPGSGDLSDWRTDPQAQASSNTISEVEDDVVSFDNQRLKDPEVVNRTTTYLPNSANSLHISHHSRSHSQQQNDPFGAASVNADPLFLDNRVGDQMLLNASCNTVVANGYPEKVISSSTGLNRNMEHMGRLKSDVTALDGENSIISNILSLDLDSWDDSLTSPQHLAKLLGEADNQPSALKMSGSWKYQNNNQSRFSFARQEEARHPGADSDSSLSVFGQLQKNHSFGQDITENRLSYLDKFGICNRLSSSNFDESETLGNGSSVYPTSMPSVSRSQISAPPGFSMPNRAPPPGFSSHERVNQIFDTMPGSHAFDSSSLLRNPYQASPTGNFSNSGDIEFMDPAILAVGKGRLQGGLNNPGFEMRSNFPHQLSAFESDARLQLLMQRSLSPHQNLRYPDIGDNFSSLSDSYGISSRLVDQSQMSNLPPFMQMSLQNSRNGLMSNGLWDGWNEVQGGNNLGMAELLRNERLGLNKYYSSGYEDSKFRMPNSGDLYNRTFEM